MQQRNRNKKVYSRAEEYNDWTEEFNRASIADSIKNKKESMNTKINHMNLSRQRSKKKKELKSVKKAHWIYGTNQKKQ